MNKNNVLLPVVLVLAAALIVGGFVMLKKHKDRVAPAPVEVVKTVEEPEPAEEEPAPPPRRQRQRRDLNASINTMNPIQTQGIPTREEAVDAAWDILSAYREATPQEKQQMAMVMYMASGLLNGIAQNAGQFIQQMPQDQRDRLVSNSAASLELLSAVQEEMINNVTPEEVQVFGGIFQSMQNLNESLMNAALF